MKTYNFYHADRYFTPIVNKDFFGIETPKDLYDALCELWCKSTCAPRLQPQWTKENKTLGQCSVTAFLAQDVFGGKVYGIPLQDGNFHCFNVVQGQSFDLTSEQFAGATLNYEHVVEQLRDTHFIKEEKKARYEYLKGKLKEYCLLKKEGKTL